MYLQALFNLVRSRHLVLQYPIGFVQSLMALNIVPSSAKEHIPGRAISFVARIAHAIPVPKCIIKLAAPIAGALVSSQRSKPQSLLPM